VVRTLDDATFRMAYLDPPFNTGRRQRRGQLTTIRDDDGDRRGFRGDRYSTVAGTEQSYADDFDDYIGFLEPRLAEVWRVLDDEGTLYLHLDYREVHHVKVVLDAMVGRRCFLNEIIWAYDYGGRPKSRWPAKHDTILWYAANPEEYVFNFDEMDRIPYMAPGLVGPEKAARGKTPTDVWWHTIVPTNGHEKTGYPTQKPLGILNRVIKVHSQPGDVVLDFFGGSGTTGEAAALHDRGFVLIDNNAEAVQVAASRLAGFKPECVGFSFATPAQAAQAALF
jgi:site-specific DNA-methyltransferase (adenine-specific)